MTARARLSAAPPAPASGAPRRSRADSVAAVVRAQVVLEEHDVAPDGSAAVVVHRHIAGNA